MSRLTLVAYETDIRQFFSWVQENDVTVSHPGQVTRSHIIEYLSYLADLGRSGVTRARKLAAVKAFFTYLVATGTLTNSPAAKVSIPKKEKKESVYLRVDEYMRLLSAAGGNPRDFCMLQVFLQTGVRVLELVSIDLSDIDLIGHKLRIHGKGNKERTIDLEKKGEAALRNYLAHRPTVATTRLFLNYEGTPISVRGVMKIVQKYARIAGTTKHFSCHSLRHTCGTYKAKMGFTGLQIKALFGHERAETSEIVI